MDILAILAFLAGWGLGTSIGLVLMLYVFSNISKQLDKFLGEIYSSFYKKDQPQSFREEKEQRVNPDS